MKICFPFFAISMLKKIQQLLLVFLMSVCGLVHAATYNLTSGSYPPCVGGSGWSVSGTTYTCGANGRVTLASGDIVTASGAVTIYANNGFSLAGNSTVGTSGARINLTSGYGSVTASGTTTIFGNINGGSGDITFTNTALNGTLTTTGNITLTGGSASGLVTSTGNTLTANGTNLSGGAAANSGMVITGGTVAGNFSMSSNNAVTFSGVTMTSGTISGASTVTIQNGSVLGSGSSAINISSNSGAISVNNSTVYGNLTAPNYSTVNVTNGAAVYGTCLPNSTPANTCGAVPLTATPMNCSAGISSGITGNYFNNRTLTEPSTGTRSDAPIDFNWGGAAPGVTGINADNFSVRWTGFIRATQTGAYRFQTVSDDGVRLYVGGNLVIDRWNDHSSTIDTTGDFQLVAGNTYAITLEYYENAADAVIRLQWRLPGSSTFVAIPGGPVPTLGAGLYECSPVSKPPVSSCPTTLSAGITGEYYNNRTLTAPIAARRTDGPINFDWGTGVPGPTGINSDNFSVRWDGYIHISQSGMYRFQTSSDDGIRLTVNGDLVIDEWNDHSVATHTSVAINLVAGYRYPIRLEYYENGGYAVAQLRWQTPGSSSYVAIPIGVNASPVSAPGLYECVAPPASYAITHNATGITCEASAITITARSGPNGTGADVIPPAGTVVTLSTNPATGVWVGGNTYTFSGNESSFIKYLQQTSPAALTISAGSTTAGINATGSSNITFANTGLKIANNFSSTPPTHTAIPTQTAALLGSAVVKAVKTDDNTGACAALVGTGVRSVGMAYSCNNPVACIVGQTLALKANSATTYTNIASNNNGAASISYTNVALNFDANGEAPINFVYSDVGQITLHGRLPISLSGNNPAITLTGSSDPFVVKPYTLVVTGAAQAASPFKANPAGTSNASQGFIPAGEKFTVNVQSRNALGATTPNFGNETTSAERNKIQLLMGCPSRNLMTDPACTARVPDYPAGAIQGALTIGEDLNADGIIDPYTTFTAGATIPAVWNEVGSFKLEPNLSGTGYLDQGNVPFITPSGIIGRFYPSHFALTSSSLTNSCNSFSYMQQPLSLNYAIEAKNLTNTKLVNYTPAYGTMPTITYVSENANSGVNLLRFSDGTGGAWSGGEFKVASTTAMFSRASPNQAPDGPFESLQIGLQLTDSFDSRSLQGLDMNASTTGNCSGSSCTAIRLGSTLNMRYGRLRLDDAFGPETAALPVNFVTEYWTGTFFTTNTDDTCTSILRSAITYPAGNILTPANLTVPLSSGTTTGSYASTTGTLVNFSSGNARHSFSMPTGGGQGNFNVNVDLAAYPWLRFDWNQDGNHADTSLPTARFGFGQYRGHDRVIYWRERFN